MVTKEMGINCPWGMGGMLPELEMQWPVYLCGMEARLDKIPVTKTARVFVLEKEGTAVEHVWFCLHGYGQLGSYFSRHFRGLLDGKTRVVVPEGLSRYYLDPEFQRVGASWMTKEDRLDEIGDYVAYLGKVFSIYVPPNPSVRVHLLGFSQGVATAWRWFKHQNIPWSTFILWAGQVPEEKDPFVLERIQQTQTHWVVGDQDVFFPEERTAGVEESLKILNPTIQIHRFPGKHTLNSNVLEKIAKGIIP